MGRVKNDIFRENYVFLKVNPDSTAKAALDIAMGAVSVYCGPVGWTIGAVYFIGDAAGWWGDWGKPTKKEE